MYIDKKSEVTGKESKHSFAMSNYPNSLSKKVEFLTRLINEFNSRKANEEFSDSTVYVKKWMKASHAYVFRLSNKNLQLVFTDNTQVLIIPEQKKLYYVNKKGIGNLMSIKSALDSSDNEMSKRIKYSKEILANTFAKSSSRTSQRLSEKPQSSCKLGIQIKQHV